MKRKKKSVHGPDITFIGGTQCFADINYAENGLYSMQSHSKPLKMLYVCVCVGVRARAQIDKLILKSTYKRKESPRITETA